MTGEVWDGWNVNLTEPKLACDLFLFLEGKGGGGGGSARPYPNKRTSCTRFFFCIPLGISRRSGLEILGNT